MDEKRNGAVIWKSKSEYVDIETGEVISKAKALKEYIKLSTTKKYKVDGINGTITYRWHCKKDGQYGIEYGTNRTV